MRLGQDLPTGDPRTWNQNRVLIDPSVVKAASAVRRADLNPVAAEEPMSPLMAGGVGLGFGFILGFLFRRRRQ